MEYPELEGAHKHHWVQLLLVFRYEFYRGFTKSRCGQVENVDLQRNPMQGPLLWATVLLQGAADESATSSCIERNAQFLICCLHLGGAGNPSQGCCHQLICTVIALVGSSWPLTDFSQFTWLKIGWGFKHIELKKPYRITGTIFALHVQVLWKQNIWQ